MNNFPLDDLEKQGLNFPLDDLEKQGLIPKFNWESMYDVAFLHGIDAQKEYEAHLEYYKSVLLQRHFANEEKDWNLDISSEPEKKEEHPKKLSRYDIINL